MPGLKSRRTKGTFVKKKVKKLGGLEIQALQTGTKEGQMEWTIEKRLPPGVAEKLGHYVYLYIHPDTGEPFYVGKGKGERVLAHLTDTRDSEKTRRIAELRETGRQPKLEILAHGLANEETAFRVEAAVIDALGLHGLRGPSLKRK